MESTPVPQGLHTCLPLPATRLCTPQVSRISVWYAPSTFQTFHSQTTVYCAVRANNAATTRVHVLNYEHVSHSVSCTKTLWPQTKFNAFSTRLHKGADSEDPRTAIQSMPDLTGQKTAKVLSTPDFTGQKTVKVLSTADFTEQKTIKCEATGSVHGQRFSQRQTRSLVPRQY